jgi:DNA-binding HxlR family transcriptional regulator
MDLNQKEIGILKSISAWKKRFPSGFPWSEKWQPKTLESLLEKGLIKKNLAGGKTLSRVYLELTQKGLEAASKL